MDFTQYLPEPLKGGNFTPPSVGQSVNVNKFFKEIDLIGERANFGIVAARIAPGLKINLQSDALSFTLHDNEANTDTLVTNSSQLVHLGINANDNSSSFSLGNPVYKLGFDITPGIDAILSIQLGVWSNDWDFPVWFPQLTIKLPPDGASFSCHAETQCSRNYHMGPAVATVSAGASSGFKGSLKDWGKDFDAYWAARCADDICKFAVTIPRFGAIADGNTMFNALPEDQRLKLDAATQNTPVVFGTDNLYHMDQKFTSADKVAQSMVADSKYRVKATGLGQNLIKIGATEYVKQCSDQQCYNEFKSIYDQESVAFDYQVKTNPAASLAELMSPVTSQYNPQYIKAVADSKARAKAAAVGIVLRIKPLNSGNAATPLLPRVNIK